MGLKHLRFWGLLVVTALVIVGWTVAPEWLDQAQLVRFICGLGPWREAGFVLAHVIATPLGLPGALLVVVGGMIFGVVWGTLWSALGATLGAIASFLLVRYWLHDWCKHYLERHPKLRRLNCRLCNRPLRYVLAVRLVPISPFNVVNFLFGLTSIPLRTYVLGTGLGILPGTLIYTWLGHAGRQALTAGRWGSLLLALAALVLLGGLSILSKSRRSP
ncbi:TVP38/TMEM64 family membrane protein [Halomicronema hongdechloris C2206]|uniref:TVP38/TMEM64 family membrane protein n=1 Tax=Halomicronema hongdechloris C2206 TaxID=1641165 RepID=A0A1Z3HGJ9_9CYAN|nr:TVP38/TMEM64 family protein [Halomicronema hongdechloris]ASC69337.1 TVP38/TMEM64 family membrane protein [Halomicronema hongdechloris C2206]